MKPMSMTIVKNHIKREYPGVLTDLKNSRINGVLEGCSGFIYAAPTNSANSTPEHAVYIDTTCTQGYMKQAMYRATRGTKDYTGLRNRWCSESQLVDNAVKLLHDLQSGQGVS